MNADTAPHDPHRARILALYGLPVRGVTLDDHNGLTIEFGTAQRTAALTTITAAWRWETADRMIAAVGDDHDLVLPAISGLVGRTLRKIHTQRPSTAAWLEFDDASSLLIFPVITEEWEHWTMRYPDGWSFTSGPGTDAGWDPPDGVPPDHP